MASSEKDRRYLMLAVRIVGEFGAIIAVPAVLLALTGMRLDALYGTRPRFLIAGFVLAAVLSAVAIYRKAKRFGKEYQEIEGPQKPV
ncbi:AtpZ/AtpI family protein [Candidatus Uhrbacteria bacterium]|nr:AtpZ/AtpI family protein [Candidatus Uhrbacteria bacterium]